jgi:hypothetical protein
MKPGWGQFFMTQRGQFRVAFDNNAALAWAGATRRLGRDRCLRACAPVAGLFFPLALALREPLKSQDTANRASIGCAASSDG